MSGNYSLFDDQGALYNYASIVEDLRDTCHGNVQQITVKNDSRLPIEDVAKHNANVIVLENCEVSGDFNVLTNYHVPKRMYLDNVTLLSELTLPNTKAIRAIVSELKGHGCDVSHPNLKHWPDGHIAKFTEFVITYSNLAQEVVIQDKTKDKFLDVRKELRNVVYKWRSCSSLFIFDCDLTEHQMVFKPLVRLGRLILSNCRNFCFNGSFPSNLASLICVNTTIKNLRELVACPSLKVVTITEKQYYFDYDSVEYLQNHNIYVKTGN